jgi:hypothetical protein
MCEPGILRCIFKIAHIAAASDVQTARLWASATLAHLHTIPEFQKLLQAAKDELNPPAKGKKKKK